MSVGVLAVVSLLTDDVVAFRLSGGWLSLSWWFGRCLEAGLAVLVTDASHS